MQFLGSQRAMESTDAEPLSTCCPLRGEEYWWIFVSTSVVLYFAGLVLSFLSYFIYWVFKRVAKSKRLHQQRLGQSSSRLFRRYRGTIRQSISGDTVSSKILITLTFICNIIYLVTYVYRTYTPFPDGTVDGKCLITSDDGLNTTTTSANRVEKCFTLRSSPEFIIELVVVLELIFFAFTRLLAADNAVQYWLDLYTAVDFFTLPHIFISITLGVDWIGVRSLRFILLPQIVNVIRFLPFVKSQDAVDVISLLIKFSALWLSCTGIIHLIEVQGDFWRNYENGGTDAFLTYAYFIMVTVSTVGYGDLSPSTDIGRAFMTFFIILGLAFFAAILPTIVDVASGLYNKRQFRKFDTTRVPRHVIVCGHITAFSAEEFLKDFLHPDRGDTKTHILFLHPERPDPDLKNVIRSHYTRVQYIVGSILNGKDLQRAKILTTQAVFILCNKLTNKPVEEDNANLLRLVSIKNTTTSVPVIIQLLLSSSKKKVQNIEGWRVGHDIALCVSELKLGLLAQSCICPGISTLIANLFYISDFSTQLKLKAFKESSVWKKKYILGASNEIYSSHFSHQFYHKKFHEAARICYNQLGLILLSLEKTVGNVRTCYVNPTPTSNPDLVIESGEEGMLGYFIGQDSDHVSIVASYCENCHGDMKANLGGDRRLQYIKRVVNHVTAKACHCPLGEGFAIVNPMAIQQTDFVDSDKTSGELQHKKRLNMLKMSHLLSSEQVDDNIEDSIHISEPVVLDKAIITDETSIVLTEKPQPNIKDHVVLCVFADETSPRLGLHNFLLPLRSKYMPKEKLKPVVIVSNKRFIEREWPLIHNIPEVYVIVGYPLRWKNLEEANINGCSVCIVLSMLASTTGREPAVDDKESILCSLTIKQHLRRRAECNVLVITDLRQESNVQFLDFGDEDEPDERIYKAQPFACGEAFSVTMLDSVTSSAFHSPGTVYLIEDLIGKRTFSQIIPMPLTEYEGSTFSELYNDQLKNHAICLGLYRRLPHDSQDESGHVPVSKYHSLQDSSFTPVKSTKHYVITAPSPSLKLEATDIAFLLVDTDNDSVFEMVL